MTTQFAFVHKYTASDMLEGPYVFVPDQVFEDQHAYDNRDFPIMYQDGTMGRAILRGELYGLWTTGTGDMVVELIED